MSSRILSGWQWDSNMSPWRAPADGFTPTRVSRWAVVAAATCCESVFWCATCKRMFTPHRLSTVQCPAHEVRYDSSGVILSPGWPESYPNLQMCSWSVIVEKGYNVTITFESFHTEREFDVLEIFDGKPETAPPAWWACEMLLILTYITAWMRLHYWFLCDWSSAPDGFELHPWTLFNFF